MQMLHAAKSHDIHVLVDNRPIGIINIMHGRMIDANDVKGSLHA